MRAHACGRSSRPTRAGRVPTGLRAPGREIQGLPWVRGGIAACNKNGLGCNSESPDYYSVSRAYTCSRGRGVQSNSKAWSQRSPRVQSKCMRAVKEHTQTAFYSQPRCACVWPERCIQAKHIDVAPLIETPFVSKHMPEFLQHQTIHQSTLA